MDREKFAAQDDPSRPLGFIRSPRASEAVALWDRTFASSFFAYRAALQDLALETSLETGVERTTVGFDDFTREGGFDAWLRSEVDELVIAIDDDDLLKPNLAEVAEAFTDDIDVVLWPREALEVRASGEMRWHRAALRVVFSTNCCLRKSYLARHFDGARAWRILSNHRLANEHLADICGIAPDETTVHGFRKLVHPGVRFLSSGFSIKNGHPGSIQFLVDAAMRDADPVEFLRSLDLRVPHPMPGYATSLGHTIDALGAIWVGLAS
jgi:hypothetical protein